MHGDNPTRELLTIEEYVTLSAKINYQLSAVSLNEPALLSLVLGPSLVVEGSRKTLGRALRVLEAGYRRDRRRLGTPGILHPLRAATLLARAMGRPTQLDLLCALLHDKNEDLTEEGLGAESWQELETRYGELLADLEPATARGLEERIELLTNWGLDTYEDYLARLLDNARRMPELLHVKLADRLDNTFDIHLQHPSVTKFNFYRAVFDILFLPRFGGVDMGQFHFMPDTDNGVMLLSQLFKDLTFLALLRSEKLDQGDETTARLFTGLAVAGIREAQWLALEMFNTCLTDVATQRELLGEVMRYCTGGGIDAVTSGAEKSALDGMVLRIFRAQQEGSRKQALAELFQDQPLLARMVLTFIVVFAAFINDPGYTIEGIDRHGIRPAG